MADEQALPAYLETDVDRNVTLYEKFGFKFFGGNPAQNWLILKNGDHIIVP